MSFNFDTLITDRKKEDVLYLSELIAKPLAKWTQEEKEAFNDGLLKGGYFWTDLNRVTDCMAFLDGEFDAAGYESGYIDARPGEWVKSDAPTETQISTYLQNVKKLRDVLVIFQDTPSVPAKIDSPKAANDIEEILYTVMGVIDLMRSIYIRSGMYNSGGVIYAADETYLWERVPFLYQVGSLVYNGSQQSPEWNADKNKYTILGDVQTDAGTYTATVKPKFGYKYEDYSVAARQVQWVIEKAVGVVSVQSSLTMNKENWNTSIVVEYNGDGQVTVSANNQNVRASYANGKINLASAIIGTTILTVRAGEGKNYKASQPVTCTVNIVDIIRFEPPSGQQYSGNILYLPDKYR